MNYDAGVDVIERFFDFSAVSNIEFNDIGCSYATQASADRLPAIQEEFSLHLTSKQAAGLIAGSASSVGLVKVGFTSGDQC